MPRRHLLVIAAVIAAAVSVLAGCTQTVSGNASSGNASSGNGSRLSFGNCTGLFTTASVPVQPKLRDHLRYGCTKLPVPLNYRHRNGRTISLQLIKIHYSADRHPIGSLLVNPGGPGASGVELALGLLEKISPRILAHFDLLGFDPRGVELSSPVQCISGKQKDALNDESPNVLTHAGFQHAKALAAQVANACSTKYGPSLAQYNTVNTARDMDAIRRAVGDKQMNYLGFSYGTQLGATYAHLFPRTIRAMVLDGAVDPLTSGITAFAHQLAGFESAFDQFAKWCTTHRPCSSLHDPREAVYDIRDTARRHPLSTHDPGETRQVTGALVLTGVLEALYSRSTWKRLGTALIQAKAGNGSELLALADEYNQRYHGHYTNLTDANVTISCNDSKPGPSDTKIRATARRWKGQFPMFGRWAAISLFGCQQWQPHRTPPPKPTAPSSTNRVLVVGNLHDPATPYQGAIDLTKVMGNAELLTWNGEGHTSYLEGSSCIDDYVNNYLITGTLPPAKTTCRR